MTREEKETIFNRLSELEEQHPAFSESVKDNAYCEAIADIKRIIERINQPSLPSNLDEAAEEYAKNRAKNPELCYEYLYYEIIEAIKFGAEWMAWQGYAREVEVREDAGGYPYIPSIELYDYDKEEPLFKPGNKVVVQIRKK